MPERTDLWFKTTCRQCGPLYFHFTPPPSKPGMKFPRHLVTCEMCGQPAEWRACDKPTADEWVDARDKAGLTAKYEEALSG